MTTPTGTATALPDLVRIVNNQPVATSLVVAQKFKKRHDSVLRAFDNLKCSPGFHLRNFVEVSHEVDAGNGAKVNYRSFEMTHDGFAFLCMGFTGKKAAQWKEEFIGAFNWQADEINRLRTLHASPDWQLARIEGKAARHAETDAIKAFVEYAKSQGSKGAAKYYLALSKAVNRSLFFVEGAAGKNFREGLSAGQLASLAMAERIVERALLEAMTAQVFYKEAFRLAADRVRQFATLVGQSVPGHTAALLTGDQ
jgi:Rha family phage regulatory protein